jgi:hypothetical protein
VLLRAGLTLGEIRAVPLATVESWLRLLREARERAADPAGRARGVRKLSRRFIEQQRARRS